MQGAREFANMFKTGRYGNLYLVSSSHGRGYTFRIFVIPKDEEVIPNGEYNPPLNNNAVEVYGVTSGTPGWNETYGWLHDGKWIDDFNNIVSTKKIEVAEAQANTIKQRLANEAKEKERVAELLLQY